MKMWTRGADFFIVVLVASLCWTKCVTHESPDLCSGLCQCSSDRIMVSCSHSGLIGFPPVPSSTIRLDLDYNHINQLKNNSIPDTSVGLQILSICDSGLRRIESGAFSSLRHLLEIRLARNQLVNLPANLFSRNRQLQFLDLSSNYFSSIPDHVMAPLHSLQTLNVSYNRLTSAKLGSGFRYTTILQSIDLSGNNIPALEEDSFSIMSHWDLTIPRQLNLSYCNIWHVAAHSLAEVPSLRSLTLEGNQNIMLATLGAALENLAPETIEDANFSHLNISDIPEFVSHLKTNSIKYLGMSYNSITKVPKRTFFFLIKLRHLDLSHNRISSVEDLAGLSKLEYLNLAYNSLISLDEMMFEGLSDLKVLDISHNFLTQLNDEPFLNLFHLNTIDLSCNEIQIVSLQGGLESLEVLRLNENRISDISFLKRLRRLHTLDISSNTIIRISDQIFSRQQNISLANFSGNAIFNISSDAFQLANYVTVDLSRNRVTNLANYGWKTIEILHLEGNSIYNLAPDIFIYSENLRELYLQNNNLYSIPNSLFTNQKRLKLLDLRNNPLGTYTELTDKNSFLDPLIQLETLRLSFAGIKLIHDALFSKLSSIREIDLSNNHLQYLKLEAIKSSPMLTDLRVANNQLRWFDVNILNELKLLKRIDISGNPFQCTCDLVSLCHKLYTGSLDVPGLSNGTLYQCSSPGEWRGVPLAVYYADSMALCKGYDNVIVTAAVACGAFVLLLIVGIAACRYRSWKRHKDSASALRKRPMIVNYKFVDERTLTTSSSSSTGSSSGDCSSSRMCRELPTMCRESQSVPDYTRQLLQPSRSVRIRE